ncbi:Co2+/Mg2+ efflux protein ApaG [Paraglaciecola arctica]|uniref:Protein ApaG n=1 Tax=Paraglaciecola arctica BSs20135 TaxID=493475 RepID=K6YC05_9ALTE|nr:Co2+/Mg2+ efflux protein ApaG [Paraglaciecola arctica]GAC21481.1 ApaG protein [Paraglaciecola arctica BSs20135]|tara:strand:- start:1584 stop:1958 length:375 start_codon:yes stop_codon:yes gene_type:complete
MNQVNKVDITVETQYLKNQIPGKDKYAFAYKISIHNNGQQSVQLLNRYWLITDGNGEKTEVQGAGVIGEQPHIQIGDSFQYTSGAVLDTPVGTMQGYYEMQREDGERFQAEINVFSLAVPNAVN